MKLLAFWCKYICNINVINFLALGTWVMLLPIDFQPLFKGIQHNGNDVMYVKTTKLLKALLEKSCQPLFVLSVHFLEFLQIYFHRSCGAYRFWFV